MSGELVAFPDQPRQVVVTGYPGLWVVNIEPRGGFETLSRLFRDRDEADQYAHSIADPHGWTVHYWRPGDPPLLTGDDGGAAA